MGSGAGAGDARPQHEVPYLHVRALRRAVGVGGEGDPLAEDRGNRTGLLQLRDQIDVALALEEGMASSDLYRETDERRYELYVMRADRRKQMGEPREPGRPDYSMFT